MTKLYFAGTTGGNRNICRQTFRVDRRDDVQVDLLVTVHGFKALGEWVPRAAYDTWCLDSGAFEALSQGLPLTYEMWHEVASSCDADEVFGLDVIGDPIATRRNVERAWADGIKAIPTFHFGSDWKHLEWAATSAPKIALGGVARMSSKARIQWIRECFRRTWPVRVHGFGVTSRGAMLAVPFHTVDSSSWLFAPRRGKQYQQYGGNLFAGKSQRMPQRAADDLWGELMAHKRVERLAAFRWQREMQTLDELPWDWQV